MIKTILIDDEEDARFMLGNMLQRKFADRVEVLGEAADVASALSLVQAQTPDLIFLDIHLQDQTGFDLLAQLPERPFEVVFATAYDQYALRAFDFSAFGYLLKPIRLSDLERVIAQAEQKLELLQKSTDKRFRVLIENYGDGRQIQKLVVSNVDGFEILTIEEIYYLEGDRNYTHFVLQNGKKVTASKTLKEFEDLLMGYGFFRIHQSYVINLRHVKRYLKGDGGMVELSNGVQLTLSRQRKADFVQRILDHKGGK